jgi:hypothetical protein
MYNHHMVLQFEDCVNVVKVLYPEYDHIFLFDHSCGHDRKRPDGLCVNSMRKGFLGGKQTVMRDSKMESEECLGQFRGLLSVSASQRMHFVPSDAGPYWMTDAESIQIERTVHLGKNKTIPNKVDLLKELQSKGVTAKGRKDELQIMCKQKNIPREEELDEVVEGWEGKPKGMLQILWEQGFINPAKKEEDSSKRKPAAVPREATGWCEGGVDSEVPSGNCWQGDRV